MGVINVSAFRKLYKRFYVNFRRSVKDKGENTAGVIVKVPRDVPLITHKEVLRYSLPLYCVHAAKQNGSS